MVPTLVGKDIETIFDMTFYRYFNTYKYFKYFKYFIISTIYIFAGRRIKCSFRTLDKIERRPKNKIYLQDLGRDRSSLGRGESLRPYSLKGHMVGFDARKYDIC